MSENHASSSNTNGLRLRELAATQLATADAIAAASELARDACFAEPFDLRDAAIECRDELTERVVDPVQVFSSNTHWYVRAWCLDAEGMRNFRLDRISAVEDAGPAGERPAAQEAAAASPPAPGTPDTVEVVLVTDRRSRWIADQYHATRTAVVRVPGGARTGPAADHEAALIGFQTVEAVCALVTRYGGQLAVIGPDDVVAQVEL